MPNKFKKRNIERKGAKKEQEKEMKLVDKNSADLANPDGLNKEFDKETAPVAEGEVESSIIGPKEGV
jgi:hypothetical protein